MTAPYPAQLAVCSFLECLLGGLQTPLCPSLPCMPQRHVDITHLPTWGRALALEWSVAVMFMIFASKLPVRVRVPCQPQMLVSDVGALPRLGPQNPEDRDHTPAQISVLIQVPCPGAVTGVPKPAATLAPCSEPPKCQHHSHT